MIKIRTATYFLIVVALVTIAPLAVANPTDETPVPDVALHATCIDVDPWSTPPVSIYECPPVG